MNAFFRAFFTRRMSCIFLLGISSGLPLLLIGGTLKAWLRDQKIDLTLIGFFALVQIPYAQKYLWSPLMDRYVPPFLGRRRGWILVCQILLTGCFVAMAGITPQSSTLGVIAALAFVTAFLSASQDIAIDAYRRDLLPTNELGLGSSLAVAGYRVALLIAGGGALFLADRMPWGTVYLVMAAIMAVGSVVTFAAPEPDTHVAPPNTLREAIVLPFKEYFGRSHALEILAFILLFKIGDSMADAMFNPFYLDLGFTKTQIAEIAKVLGFTSTIVGGIFGGAVMLRIGIVRSLWIFGLLQTVSTFGFSLLAQAGPSLSILTGVIILENLCTAAATAAYVAFMSSLCNVRFTATQFALLSSLMGVPRSVFGSSAGYLAENLGWWGYFILCTALHLPGLLMLLRVQKFYRPEESGS